MTNDPIQLEEGDTVEMDDGCFTVVEKYNPSTTPENIEKITLERSSGDTLKTIIETYPGKEASVRNTFPNEFRVDIRDHGTASPKLSSRIVEDIRDELSLGIVGAMALEGGKLRVWFREEG